MNGNKSRMYTRRFSIMMLFVICVLIGYECILFNTQIVNGDEYETAAIQYTASSVSITAARGEIVDRYGRQIVGNRMGYSIIFNKNDMPTDQTNEIIWHLTRILSEQGEEWIDNCPIEISASGTASFVEGEDSLISKMKTALNLQSYASAQNCLDTMNEKYEVGNLDAVTARTIMGVRLNMDYMNYSTANAYTFAEDISLETMQMILENSAVLPGVEVSVVPIREYADGTIAPHLIGTTGPIYAEEWEELKAQGYSITASVGKFGIESIFESYLKGTNGVKKIEREDGKIVYEEITRDAVPGNTVVLTIDSELQKVAQESMETTIKAIQARGVASGRERNGADANAGACVVINCRTFEVLAAVTYPSYDLTRYNQDYSELLATDGSPLFNRVLQGTYAPGSTFKPAVALAGLQAGTITKNTKIECTGYYYLEDYDFGLTCLHVHGALNVSQAIEQSCNVFFYYTGYNLGITDLNDYCRQLGLGVATGVGMGEAVGVLAGREEREAQELGWYPADTLTASIGQNDNKFTPMQLACYVATIANGGTRYEARLIKTVKSYDMTETIIEDTSDDPTILNKLNVDSQIIRVVKEGMLAVTEAEGGTASTAFADYSIKVGGKTGTADTTKTATANALFIAFAPYDEPEIAIAIVGERCGYGSYMAPVARDILDYYFFSDTTGGYDLVYEGDIVE